MIRYYLLSFLFCSLFSTSVFSNPDENVDDPAIKINELVLLNTSGATDELGEIEPWIELYNTRDLDFTLIGYFLTNDSLDVFKWEIPQGTKIPKQAYQIIWMDGDVDQGLLHCSFELDPNGGDLWLVNQDGEIQDHIMYGPQETDMSLARVPDGDGDFVVQSNTFNSNNEWLNGLSQAESDLDLLLFPNPCSAQLQIKSLNAPLQRYTIFDANGRLIVTGQMKGQEFVDVTNWPSGLYLFKSDKSQRTFLVQ